MLHAIADDLPKTFCPCEPALSRNSSKFQARTLTKSRAQPAVSHPLGAPRKQQSWHACTQRAKKKGERYADSELCNAFCTSLTNIPAKVGIISTPCYCLLRHQERGSEKGAHRASRAEPGIDGVHVALPQYTVGRLPHIRSQGRYLLQEGVLGQIPPSLCTPCAPLSLALISKIQRFSPPMRSKAHGGYYQLDSLAETATLRTSPSNIRHLLPLRRPRGAPELLY